MIPKKNNNYIKIPLTFDVKTGIKENAKTKLIWSLGVVGVCIFLMIVYILALDGLRVFIMSLLTFIVGSLVIRHIIIKERFYLKQRRTLAEKEYLFDHSQFWSIYEYSNQYPYIVTFQSGVKGVFIYLDKDVVVGKDSDYEYYHHEAISEALRQMKKRGLEAIHIDYMDVAGRDDRMADLFNLADGTNNEDLRRLLTRVFDHISTEMNNTYATYDVYCFYTNESSQTFWEDVKFVLEYFKQANYRSTKPLRKEEVAVLVESLNNLETFSVNNAVESVLKGMNRVNFITPIWVEKNGERTILNQTTEEKLQHQRIKQAEKKVKRKKKSIFKRKKDEDIDLFS